MLFANAFYIHEAWKYNYGEGVSCLLMAFSGYMIYTGARLLNIDLSSVIFSIATGVEMDKILKLSSDTKIRELISVIFSIIIGWGAGKIYINQAKKNNFKSFRWIMLLLSIVHAIIIDSFLFLIGSQNLSNSPKAVTSAMFIIGVIFSWAQNYEGEHRGNIINPEDTKREAVATNNDETIENNSDNSLRFE